MWATGGCQDASQPRPALPLSLGLNAWGAHPGLCRIYRGQSASGQVATYPQRVAPVLRLRAPARAGAASRRAGGRTARGAPPARALRRRWGAPRSAIGKVVGPSAAPSVVTLSFVLMWYGLNVAFNLLNKTIFNYFPFPYTVSAVHVVVGLAYCTLTYLFGAKKASFGRARAPPSSPAWRCGRGC